MASRTATVRNVVIERGPDDARTDAVALAVGNLRRATVYLDPGGLVVTAGADTLDCNLATAIQNSERDGKTVTILGCPAITQALTTVTNAGVEVTHAGFTTLSTNTISITPKSDGYVTGSANSTITASLPYQRPYAVMVSYMSA
ncbi:hypothetical protein D4Q85_01130 [bacterium]|nr:MAG: hypothetical protein D4Q85_01130 [bacterium]